VIAALAIRAGPQFSLTAPNLAMKTFWPADAENAALLRELAHRPEHAAAASAITEQPAHASPESARTRAHALACLRRLLRDEQ
jgi:hypothetical protein